MMKIPNADFLERTKSEILGARLWRLLSKSAMTLHKHPKMEEFYFVLEGGGRIRINDQTITVQRHGGVLVGPQLLRQVFNDTESEVLWLIIGAPEAELERGGRNTTKHVFIPSIQSSSPPKNRLEPCGRQKPNKLTMPNQGLQPMVPLRHAFDADLKSVIQPALTRACRSRS